MKECSSLLNYFPLMEVPFKWLLKFPSIIESQPLSVKGGQSYTLFTTGKTQLHNVELR